MTERIPMRFARTDGGTPPRVRLDRYRLFVGITQGGEPEIWWQDGMTPADARRWLDHIHTTINAYLDEVSQPQPPRERVSPHYQPPASIYADPLTYDNGD